MNNAPFAAFDIGLVFALALGVAIWQLVALKRGIRRTRSAARSRDAGTPGSGAVIAATAFELFVLGLAVWPLITVRRSIRADGKKGGRKA